MHLMIGPPCLEFSRFGALCHSRVRRLYQVLQLAVEVDSTIGDHRVGPGHARVVPTTANPRCVACNKLPHAMTTTWWHRIKPSTCDFDSEKGRRSRTSSPCEKVLHLFNISCTVTSLLRREKQRWLFNAQSTSQSLRPSSRGRAPPRCSLRKSNGSIQSRSPAALLR